VASITNVFSALTNVASFSWAITDSLGIIIGLYTGWESSSSTTLSIAITVSLIWLGMAFLRMQDISLLFIFNGKTQSSPFCSLQ
jgi:hypothetical protein